MIGWWQDALAMCGLCLFGVLWFVGWVGYIQLCCKLVWAKLPFSLHSSLTGRSVGKSCGDRKQFFGVHRKGYSSQPVMWLVLVLFFGGLRCGEASNPGPCSSDEWSLGTFNPTGVTSKAELIARLSGDVWGVTETHLSYEGYRKFKHGLACNKAPFKFCIPGAHCSLRKRSQSVGSFSGVLCLSRWPARALPHSMDNDLFESSRIQVYGVCVCVDQLWLTMGVVYGVPESIQHEYPKYQTELLLEQVIDRVALQCKGSRVIMGDFNWLAGDLTQLRRLESLGFRDLQTLAHEWWGVNFCPTGRGDKAIDFVYISPELFPLLSGVAVQPVWPDHSAVVGKFSKQFTCLRELHWKVPGKVEWPDHEWICSLPAFSDDVSTDFALSWSSIENQASQVLSQKGHQSLSAGQCGRGQVLDTIVRKSRVAPIKKGRAGESQPKFFGGSWQYTQRYRQLRRVQSLVRLLKKSSFGFSTEVWQLWKAIRWSSGYSQGFGAWWEAYGFAIFKDVQHEKHLADAALGNAEEAPRDGIVLEHCFSRLPWPPPTLDEAQALFRVVQHDVTRLEKALIHVRYKQSKARRAADLRYVFRDCAKDAPEPVALIHHSVEGELEAVDPDLGRFQLREYVPLCRTSPIVVQGQSFTLNSQQGVVLEVREPIPDSLEGTVRQSIVKASVDDILQAFQKEWPLDGRESRILKSPNGIRFFISSGLGCLDVIWEFPPWTRDAFRQVVKSKKAKAAVGADGITRADLMALPSRGIDRMLQFFSRAEQHGQWPLQLTVGIVNSLEKSPGSLAVSGFRPIVAYPFLYRVWSSYRSKQFLKQFVDVAPVGLKGGLPCCQAKSIWYSIAVHLEHDHHSGASTIGVVADLVRAFNAIPRLPVYAIMQAMGVPDWVITTWGAFVAKQTRRFKVRGSLGDAIPSTSGFPEGCGWSVCAMAVIDLALDIWLQGLEAKPSVFTYVDDWQILHSSLSSYNSVIDRLDTFVNALQMDLDKKKTFVWGSSKDARSSLQGGAFEIVAQCRNLGAQSNFTKRCGNKVLVDRLQAMPKTWKLFRSSLASYDKKTIALRMLAWPRALHGISVVRLGKAHFETARTQALRGLRSEKIGAHPLLHLSVLGVGFDPEGWALLQTFKDAPECGDSDHFKHLLLQSFVDRRSIPANGPVALLRDRAESLGWRPTSFRWRVL